MLATMICLGAAVHPAMAHAADRTPEASIVVPMRTIHKGEIIRMETLVVQPRPMNPSAGEYHRTAEDIIGRIAGQTLRAYQPIPIGSTTAAPIVQIGSTVRLRFRSEGVAVDALGVALQTGSIGARIRARNLDTSVIVQGVLTDDGALMIVTQ